MNAVTTTNSRFLRLAETRMLNTAASYRTWFTRSAARTTIRSPSDTPAARITRVASSGAVRTGRGSNRSGATCRHTMASPFALRTTASRGTISAVTGSPLVAMTVTGRPMPRFFGRILDRELRGGCVLPQCRAESLEPQHQRLARRRGGGRFGERGRIDVAVDQGLDPDAAGIDDLEQDVLGLHDLAGDDAGGGDHAARRRAQRLRLGPRRMQRLAPAPQPVELDFGVDDLALRHHLLFCEQLRAAKLRFRDRDQLLDLADAFGNRGAIGERERRFDLRQQVSFFDGLPHPRAARPPGR